jgi:hypothetical protein
MGPGPRFLRVAAPSNTLLPLVDHPAHHRLLGETRRPNVVACGRRSRNDLIERIESGGRVLDPKYVDVIVKRWELFTGRTATCETLSQSSDLQAARG